MCSASCWKRRSYISNTVIAWRPHSGSSRAACLDRRLTAFYAPLLHPVILTDVQDAAALLKACQRLRSAAIRRICRRQAHCPLGSCTGRRAHGLHGSTARGAIVKRYTYETGIRCTRAWFAERGFIEYRDALGRVAFLLRELYD